MTEKIRKVSLYKLNYVLVVATLILILSYFLNNYNRVSILESSSTSLSCSSSSKILKYWSICINEWNPNGNLRTMNRVFDKLGYKFVNASESEEWDLLWSIEYVERNEETFRATRKSLLPHQRINHFPGIHFITNKKILGKHTNSKHLFPTFSFPEDENMFNEFSKTNPHAKYVEKNYDNRGVRIVTPDEFDKNNDEKIYQVFMDNPFLIDDHAFDFGVYVLISSVNPLRIYRYDHEVFIRFCPEKYHPFDPLNTHKYVVDENHLSVYVMPSFKNLYNKYNYTAKSIFEFLIRKKGYNVKKFWLNIDETVSDIISKNENKIIENIKHEKYENSHHFFELVRFDIILDNYLNPFVMEVNMSPNLTPAKKKHEKYTTVYEQLVYNTINLVGAGSYEVLMSRFTNDTISVNSQNIATNLENCLENTCQLNCEKSSCAICIPCISSNILFHLNEAYCEHIRKGNFKRAFPISIHFNNTELFETLSENNQIMIKWYEAKCENDESWC
ncbi:hypothetical protein PVAND_007221 [Polypedilum vanderplanki]|uniref:Uncharacterized protein n=1 Tax=Polypedilum vanderplanki TaxID=319348 RepID=A0A9J6C655_POLVA|nr:hypothetical protein PVAND_007221 [Polypedilum vanderplanki]